MFTQATPLDTNSTLFQGLQLMICINATTGDTTWTLNGGVAPTAAADGYVIGYRYIRWKRSIA